MSTPAQELDAMSSCWGAISELPKDARERVVWWLLDAARSDSQGRKYIVHLHSFGERKIDVIKVLRAHIPRLGLKEAKTLAESAPTDVGAMFRDDADRFVSALASAGATVNIV